MSQKTDAQIYEELAAPFPADQIKTRKQGGRELSYITARTARRRLNDVVGPSAWTCDIVASDRFVKCRLTIRFPDEGWIYREAIGGYPDMPSAEDRVKGGDSDAFKRACATFGVAEYLYGDDEERPAVTPLPVKVVLNPPTPQRHSKPTVTKAGGDLGWPSSGASLYAWLMKLDEVYSKPKYTASNLVNSNFGDRSPRKWPKSYKDWSAKQVEEAALFVADEVSQWEGYSGEFNSKLNGAIPKFQQVDEDDVPY